MTTESVKKLPDSALANFDHDYVSEPVFAAIVDRIRADRPDGRFTFLDVGGGKGFFADRVLEAFPECTGVVLDNADLLLYDNVEHPRKRLVLGSATELEAALPGERFDVAFFNFALHHFIGPSYAATRRLQRDSLRAAGAMLAPGGRIAVTEITYNGVPFHNLPGRVVYALTSSKTLAPLTSRLGANTAGAGVCFLSNAAWTREFEQLGFTVATTQEPVPPRPLRSRLRHAAVGATSVVSLQYWLTPRR